MLKIHHRPRRRLLHRFIEGTHQLDAGPLLGLKGVPVLVQGNGCVGVAQQFGEGHRVHALLQGSGGKGVAQRMEVGAWDARPGHAPLKNVLIGSRLIGLPILLTKDVATGTPPGVRAAADGLRWHASRESHPSEDRSELPPLLAAVAGQEYHYQIADEGRTGITGRNAKQPATGCFVDGWVPLRTFLGRL